MYFLLMRRLYYIYQVNEWIGIARNGQWQMRQEAKRRGGEFKILEELPDRYSLVAMRLKWIARLHSRGEDIKVPADTLKLALRLWYDKAKKRKGSAFNFKHKTKHEKEIDAIGNGRNEYDDIA